MVGLVGRGGPALREGGGGGGVALPEGGHLKGGVAQRALHQLAGILLGRRERYWHPSVSFYEHMPAWRVRAYVGEAVWGSYFKFAFDRNPWDRQVSWYLYKTKTKRFRPSFERFMGSRRRAYVKNYAIYTIEGSPAVDFVGRYENLKEDLNGVLSRIGIKERLKVPRVNVTQKGEARDYRDYYSPKTRAMVEECLRERFKVDAPNTGPGFGRLQGRLNRPRRSSPVSIVGIAPGER